MNAPDSRGWLTIGLFALAFYILTLLALVPNLDKNELFGTLASAVVTAGLISGAVSYFFGTNKGSSDKDATISKQLDKQ